jgi:hypothetical protein
MKLITAVIYGFRNMLERFSLKAKLESLLRKPYITAVISFMIQVPGAYLMTLEVSFVIFRVVNYNCNHGDGN